MSRDSSTITETVRGGSICGHKAREGVWQSGKGVDHNIGDTGHVDEIPGALSNKGQLSLIPGCPGLINSGEGHQQGFVVSPQLKLAALQCKPDVADGGEGCQELTVESRVLTLRCQKLLGEESLQPPTFYLFLWEDTTNMGVGGVSGKGELPMGERVHQ